jgi:hypothetical protein
MRSRTGFSLAQSPWFQSHRLPIARLAQRIVRSGDEVFKIERSQGAAGLVEFGFAPGGFDFSPLGVLAVVAGDELRGGGDRGIATRYLADVFPAHSALKREAILGQAAAS